MKVTNCSRGLNPYFGRGELLEIHGFYRGVAACADNTKVG